MLFEYQAALIALVLAVYVAVSYGRHALLRFCLGGVPAALALGAYNWGAFGSPVNLSYKYVSNQFTDWYSTRGSSASAHRPPTVPGSSSSTAGAC